MMEGGRSFQFEGCGRERERFPPCFPPSTKSKGKLAMRDKVIQREHLSIDLIDKDERVWEMKRVKMERERERVSS